MLNKYVFDYQLVVEEDPTFEKFIEYKECHRPTPPPTTNEPPEPINQDTCQNNTQEENEIINLIHSEADNADWAFLNGHDGEDIECDGSKEVIPLSLKPEYEDPPNPNYDPSVLQLLPPTRFLKEGSKIWLGEDTFYSFSQDENRKHQTISRIIRHHFSHHPPFVRLIRTRHWFNRSINAMSEYRKHFKALVYNTETRRIYHITKCRAKGKKRAHYHTRVRSAFNTLYGSGWNCSPERLTNKFLNIIIQIVAKDVGEIVIPNTDCSNEIEFIEGRTIQTSNAVDTIKLIESQTMCLLAVVLQHKINQPVRWLNHMLALNLLNIMRNLNFHADIELSINTAADMLNLDQRARRNTVGKLVPNLRKSNHMRTAVKAVLGKDYKKFFVKLFNLVIVEKEFMVSWISCERNGLISKDLYHWFVQAINNNDIQLIKYIMEIASPLLRNLANEGSRRHRQPNYSIENLVASSYIKTCRRLAKTIQSDKHAMPSWHIWDDMYNMADQLNIRIRPNKLTPEDIHGLHDRMTDIIRRDRRIINEYKDVIFDEFTSPDKDYDGFRFIQLRTAEDLGQEGVAMHHCVGSYVSRCAKGRSIIFSMRKDSKSYVTIELAPQKGYIVLQQYTLHDITVTNKMVLDLMQRWHSDCLALHEGEEKSYYDTYQDKIKSIKAEATAKVATLPRFTPDMFERGLIEDATAI